MSAPVNTRVRSADLFGEAYSQMPVHEQRQFLLANGESAARRDRAEGRVRDAQLVAMLCASLRAEWGLGI